MLVNKLYEKEVVKDPKLHTHQGGSCCDVCPIYPYYQHVDLHSFIHNFLPVVSRPRLLKDSNQNAGGLVKSAKHGSQRVRLVIDTCRLLEHKGHLEFDCTV